MVWVIRYIIGVLIKHDAWDVIVEIPPTCNQLKSNTCKAKEPCMLISPKDQDLAMQWTSSTSPLLWISQATRASKKLLTSPFPTGTQIRILTHFTLFSLKERARKLPWVFPLGPWVHTHQKKDKSPSYLIFDSFKEPTTIKNSLPLSFLRVQHKKKEKLSIIFSLSHLQVQQQEGSFFQLSQALYLSYFLV